MSNVLPERYFVGTRRFTSTYEPTWHLIRCVKSWLKNKTVQERHMLKSSITGLHKLKISTAIIASHFRKYNIAFHGPLHTCMAQRNSLLPSEYEESHREKWTDRVSRGVQTRLEKKPGSKISINACDICQFASK